MILNYIYANQSMKNGETWTPICVPGITEEHILFVYMHYHTPNAGIIFICTDHRSEIFFECQKHSLAIFQELSERGLLDIINRCTVQMYEMFGKATRIDSLDMREIQLVIIRNNTLN